MKCQKLHQKLKVKPLSVLIYIFTKINAVEKSIFLIKSLMKSETNNLRVSRDVKNSNEGTCPKVDISLKSQCQNLTFSASSKYLLPSI